MPYVCACEFGSGRVGGCVGGGGCVFCVGSISVSWCVRV